MKTKIIIFLAMSTLVTLSFTFISVKMPKKNKLQYNVKNNLSDPIGGFTSEDNL